MARPLKIEYPDAWYHVMNRGRRSEKIFHDRHDYQAFVDLLEESSEILYRSIRGQFNEPRNVAIYLTRKLRRDSLKEVGFRFQMEKYSSVSSIIERMKKQILADKNFKKRVAEVANKVGKSQEQT